jgi:large subunit ribosomal protein L23
MSSIIIKPIITEKATAASEKMARYGFVVARKANKLEIKKAIEKHYNVSVKSVNTMLLGGGKEKMRNTIRGVAKSPVPIVKKAFVTLAEGDVIDLYSNI